MRSIGIRRRVALLLAASACTSGALVPGTPAQAAPAQTAPGGAQVVTAEVPSLGAALADIKARRAASADVGALACSLTTIRAATNGQYVSTELGWTDWRYGMLRARAATVGPWEHFLLCQQPDGAYAINGWNGLWVSAELAYGDYRYGMLRARADAIGPWERFMIQNMGDGTYAIQSLANWRYVAVEKAYTGDNYGMLRARTTSGVGPWERFYY